MIMRLSLSFHSPQNDSMALRSMGFFVRGRAAFVLFLLTARLPSVAAAQMPVNPRVSVPGCDGYLGESGAVPEIDCGRDHYGFHPFTLRYRILPHSPGERGGLYLDSGDSGALRIETDGAEPLPPVSVEGAGPYPLQVNPVDAISGTLAPTETAQDTVETPEGKLQQSPSRESPRRRPRARLTGLQVSEGREPSSKGEKNPSPSVRKDLTFSFTGVDRETRSMKFRYRLEGLNSEWIETDRPSVHYAGLQARDYRFEVQAVNDAGLWSQPVGLSFSVLPPPWWRRYRPLAVPLAGMGIVLTVSLYSAVRTRRLLQMERLRASIAANLHDQIGAGLTDIAILSEVAARKAGDLPELARVATTARELVDGLGDIVWLVNPRRDSLYELFLRLKDAYAELFAHHGAQLDVGDLSPFEKARLPMAYRQDLHLLFQEALRNALRHSGCRRAELSVTLNGRDLEVQLRDDGRGFDPERRRGEGLETMRRRAERLGGRLVIESSPTGTLLRFTGRIP